MMTMKMIVIIVVDTIIITIINKILRNVVMLLKGNCFKKYEGYIILSPTDIIHF